MQCHWLYVAIKCSEVCMQNNIAWALTILGWLLSHSAWPLARGTMVLLLLLLTLCTREFNTLC